MEFYQLSDGSTTVYLRSKTTKNIDLGAYSNYLPEITQSFDPSFEGMPFVEVKTGNFTAEYKEIATLTGTEFDVTYSIWDEEPDTSPFVVFTGKAQFVEYNVKDDKNFREQVFAKYKLVANRTILEDDLLSSAYDLKQVDTDTATYNDGRLTPMNFGYVKYAPAFMLALTCATGCGGVYSADGKTTNMTQEGIDTNFTQGAGDTYAVVTDPKPPYPVYQDVDATGTTATSVTVEPIVTPVQAALTVPNVGIVETQGGIDYVAYIEDVNNEKTFSIDRDGNTFQRGISLSANGTNSTATRLTIIGGTAPSSGLTSTTRLDFIPTKDGTENAYVWDTSTNAGWKLYKSIGRSTGSLDVYVTEFRNDDVIKSSGGTADAYYAQRNTDARTTWEGAIPTAAIAATSNVGRGGIFTSVSYEALRADGGTGKGISLGGAGGHIKFDSGDALPSPTSTDRILHWNATSNKLEAWDGTTWHPLW